MSDEDDIELVVPKKTRVLHYGSLEEKERARLASEQTSGSLASDAVQAGIESGNINISSS